MSRHGWLQTFSKPRKDITRQLHSDLAKNPEIVAFMVIYKSWIKSSHDYDSEFIGEPTNQFDSHR